MTTVKITKHQLKNLIKKSLLTEDNDDYVDLPSFSAPDNEGSSRIDPEIQQFLYRGQPTQGLHEQIEQIVSDFENGGIQFQIDSSSVVKMILQAVHRIVKENADNDKQ